MPNLEDYTVGWICAVQTELVAAQAFLDEKYDVPDDVSVNDNNTYTLGRVGKHKVVIAVMPKQQYGLVNAATVARDMVRSFSNIRIGLMVGIAGGAPSQMHDIRLGDVVVGSPGYGNGGIFQYDYGKTIQGKSFTITGHLNQSPQAMLTALTTLGARYEGDGHGIEDMINGILEKKPRLRAKYRRPAPSTDRLYKSTCVHNGGDEESCASVCSNAESDLILRDERLDDEDNPAIHYGLIASANQLMKDALIRDKLAAEKGVLCFEMEAAGLMNHFPCLVVRGICDYSDTHKNQEWQGYAAMAAAAYAKDLLNTITPNKVAAERKLSEILSDVKEDVKQIRAGVERGQAHSHFNQVISWLSPPDPSTNLNTALKRRNPGSGQWLLRHAGYSTWKSEPNSFLWLHGIPGCGKTILSSTVVEDLRNTHPDNHLYFYFDFTDSDKQHLDNAIRSLISQLYHQREDVREHLHLLHSSCGRGRQQPSLELLCTTFQDMVQQVGEVCIVLDALDECSTRNEYRTGLLQWIQNLRNTQMDIHLLVTSRPEQDIKTTIENCCRSQDIIPIQSNLIEEDIHMYIHARVQEHQGLQRWQSRPDVQTEIKDALTEKADGMFRWVSCQLDDLEKCISLPQIRKTLRNLPKTLDDTYARILNNIPDLHKEHAKRLLQFLAFSERPLRLDEAVDAIAVDTANKPYFDLRNRIEVPEEIAACCSSLVVIIQRKNGYDTDYDNYFDEDKGGAITVIQLAHFSVKEYLTSNRLEGDICDDFLEMNARATIAKTCLAYLLSINQDIPFQKIRREYPMSHYSARYWLDNAVVTQDRSKAVRDLSAEIFQRENAWKTSYHLHNPDHPWLGDEGKELPLALYYASFGGLEHAVHLLLEGGADVNAQGGLHGNALSAASYGEHMEIIQILLEKGADVNAQGGRFGNALSAASFVGHMEIVHLLLEGGADVNAQGGRYRNALSAASYGEHMEIIQILLEKGADVNAQGGRYGNALSAASFVGHMEIVQILLEKGADVNAQGWRYGNALSAASYAEHMEIVQILLDKGADPESSVYSR
ncbi:hypothetical protein F4818DRAFT_448840 [Hypoxylon cercidicola]|nr:hypothetical protein F4818DRAFT_448840 [Hypoxylon cercidicola]